MDESILSSIVNFMTNQKLDSKILRDETYSKIAQRKLMCSPQHIPGSIYPHFILQRI